MRNAVVVALAVVVAAACDNSLEPVALEIDLQASSVDFAAGDTINFLVIAQGTNLAGAMIDFADGVVDQFGAAGARTAHITFKHAYSVTGNFRVRASVIDASGEERSDSLDVVVK
jgi:hypothetical protein